MLTERIASFRRKVSRQEGFSLIEVTLAFGVLFIALLALARTATIAFSDVSFGRQRQTANQLANQLLEEIRALPYDTIKKGLSSSDLTTDPANIKNCSGTYRYLSCTATGVVGSAERIIHDPNSASDPLQPHQGTFGPPQYTNNYAWRTYVTEANPADVPSKGAYRVTVVVDWDPTSRAGARTELNVQTLVFSPDGCIDSATHPFGAPCQAYLYSTGSVGGGTFTATGTFFTEAFDSIGGSMLAQSSDMQVEQISRVEGDVRLPGVTKTVAGTPTQVTAGATSAADSDPATATGVYLRQTAGPQPGGDVEIRSGPDRMNMTMDGSDSGNTTSTTSAGGANSCNLQTLSQPCGYAEGVQAGAMSHTFNLQNFGTGTVFSAGTSPASTPITTFANRLKPVATEAGFVREQVSWRLPEIRVGGIPSVITSPSGWAGYWVRLTGFVANAQVEAGVGAAAPTVSITGGTIETWNGSGYTSTPVTTAGGEIIIEPVSEQTSGSPKKQVNMSGTVTFDQSIATSAVSGTARTEAKATIGAPLTVEMQYTLTYGNDVVVNLATLFTTGTAELTANYTP